MNKLKRYVYCNSFHNREMEECEVKRLFVFNGAGCGDYYTDYNEKPVTGIVIDNGKEEYVYNGFFFGHTEEEFNKNIKLLVFK